jgi:uncharacterized protein YndB with AHSA1/START domain
MQLSTTRRAGIAFRIKKRFNAPREKVFDAWTKPEVLKQWWCPEGWTPTEIEVDLRVGGAFRIGMQRLSGGTTVYVRGRFSEIHAPETLSFSWQWENAFDGMPQTYVTLRFKDVGIETELLLMHQNLPEIPVCLQHRSGWLEAFNRMERVLRRYS